MTKFPILYWPRRTTGDNEYQLARKVINGATGVMPEVITGDIDIVGVLDDNPNAAIYFLYFAVPPAGGASCWAATRWSVIS